MQTMGTGVNESSFSISNKDSNEITEVRLVSKKGILCGFIHLVHVAGLGVGLGGKSVAITEHALWPWGLRWRWSFGTRPRGQQEERFRRICSCRAAAPGAERCVCASRGEGCGCTAPRWGAAGGSGPTRSGQSSHKTPEERGAWRWLICFLQ